MKERVILVDENDNEIGTQEKMATHRKGLLHRAISVVVFNKDDEILIQKRASIKYHWPGIWANTCCTHPRPGESVKEAAERRLEEEMGFRCALTEQFSFTYRAEYDNGLIEHEIDHVFFGRYDGDVSPEPSEVQDHAWQSLDSIREEMAESPEKYAPWARMIFERISHP